MRKFLLRGFIFLAAFVTTLVSVAQNHGPFDRLCTPRPGLDGVLTREPKQPPMSAEQKQAYFNNRQNSMIEVIPPGCTDLIVDGGFETGGIPSINWNPETSTNFGTPLCNVGSCGTGGGTAPPRTGAIWAWFGGIPAPETATIGQTVTIPAGTATLNFWMRIGAISAPFTDVLNVRVDGVIVQTFTEPAVAEGAYTERTIDLTSYANGGAHTILFEYIGLTNGTANFVIDDVEIASCPCTPTSITLGVSPAVCSGVTSASLPYTATTGTPDQYSIDYDAAAEAQGFVDVVNAALPASPITLTVPGAAVAATYNGSITVRLAAGGCVSMAVPFTVTINPTPTISSVTATPDFVCIGSTTQLNAVVNNSLGYTTTPFVNYGAQANAGPTGDDVASTPINIGFPFNYFGTTYTQFGIVTNGFIQLGAGPYVANFTNQSIPNVTTPNNYIALDWDDWIANPGNITYATVGVAPNRQLIVSYSGMNHFSGVGIGVLNGQIVLNETSNLVDIVNVNITSTTLGTQGVENAAGTMGLAIAGRNNQNFSSSNETWRFSTGSNFNYSWTANPVAAQAGISNPAIANPVATVNVSAIYSIAVADAVTGCSSSSSVTVTANPIPTVNVVANQAVCNGANTAAITFSGAVAGTVYNWTNDIPSIGLLASGSGNIASFVATNGGAVPVIATIIVTPSYTNGGTTCLGTPITFTITVNPTPTATASPNTQIFCSGNAVTTIVLSGPVAGTVYNWTRDNIGAATGIAASGAGNISGTLTNTTNAPVTVTFAITPTANGCPGTQINATVIVNPIPTITPVANQMVCNGAAIPAVNFSVSTIGGTNGTSWTNSNTAIGIPANGTGNISGFTGTNGTNAPISGIITVTPSFTFNAVTCTGPAITYTVTINPTSSGTATPASQTPCSGSPITTIVLSGPVSGTTYNWTRDNTVNVTGIGASGSGNISGTLTNTTVLPVTVTFTITPTANGCPGTPFTASVTVYPSPTVNPIANQVVCNTASTAAVTFTSPVAGTTFSWVNNAPFIGLAASGSGNTIPAFTAINTGNTPIVATVTVTPTSTTGGCTPSATQTFTNSTPTAIPTGPAVVTSTLVVSGAPVFLYDLNVLTNITHTFAADLDITITSPAGTVVTLTTDNGAGNDNVFNGTLWDDDANPLGQVPYTSNNGMVTDNTYANLTTATPLTPEEALAAFIGENPNGTWTITISDDLTGDGGSLDSWALQVSGLASAPAITSSSFTQSTPVTIPTGPGVVTSTLVVSGAGTLLHDVNLITNLTHTFSADLDITITSPSGTVVTLTTDNGAGNDNVFNGTTWDDDANPAGTVPYTTNNGMATDHAYVNLTTATPLAPEEPLGAFIGENPNGTWTITISDDLTGDGGSLASWTLNLQTASCPAIVCVGPTRTFTYTVNPTPTAVATPSSQTICSGAAIAIVLSGPVAGTTFSWTRDNTVAVTGIVASGTGNFGGILTNTTAAPVTVTFTITPTANGCPGVAITATVLVKPTPIITLTPAAPVICVGDIQQITASVFGTTPQAFSQPATTTIPASGIANPYPTMITAAGLPTTGVIVNSVSLGNYNHTFPSDVDVVLVSPTGQAVIIMSDAGDATDAVGLNYTFSDAAANSMIAGVNATGTYKPTNIGAGDNWPAPGPLGAPTSTLLSTFSGNPNGDWKLYVVDDAGGDAGFIGNWSITFGLPTLVTFSPTTNLFSNALATIPYLGTPTSVVWAKPPVTTLYTATSTIEGCTGTATVNVTVNNLPAITVQPTPATQTICPGFTVTYSVTATGTALTYQWKQGATNLVNNAQIFGATSNTLTIFNVNAANSGTYTCVVSGFCPPAVTSMPVVLNVATPPVISGPANAIVCAGQNASFTVATVGSVPPPTIYQWQVSANGLPAGPWVDLLTGGSFTPTFTITGATTSQSGSLYRVRVTNSCGQTTTSGNALLTVNALPVVTAAALPSRICLSDALIPLSGSPVGGSWSGIGVSGTNFVPSVTAVGTYNLTYTFTNALGCTNTAVITAKVEDCQERLRLLRDDALILYPNPNNGRFNIRINSTLYNYLGMRVYNALGQLVNGVSVDDVLKSPVYNGLVYGQVVPIDLSRLPAGVYLVEFYYDDGVRTSEKTFKVIIGAH